MKKIKTSLSNQSIASWGMYLALFLIFGLVPYIGFWKIGPKVFTFMAIPVTIVTLHKGKSGAIFGMFMFGLTSICMLPVLSSLTLDKLGWGHSIITFFLGRLLIIPFLLIYLEVTKNKKINTILNGVLVSLIVVVLNVFFVLSFYYAFLSKGRTFWFFFTSSSLNVIIEWTVVPVVCGFSSALALFLRNKEFNNKKIRYK